VFREGKTSVYRVSLNAVIRLSLSAFSRERHHLLLQVEPGLWKEGEEIHNFAFLI
jgi:hypothetical protein